MQKVIPVIGVFLYCLFVAISAVFNLNELNHFYAFHWGVNSFIFAVVVAYCFIYFCKEKTIPISYLIVLIFSLWVICSYIQVKAHNDFAGINIYLVSFFIWGVQGLLLGGYIAQKDFWFGFYKRAEFVYWVLLLAIIVRIDIPFFLSGKSLGKFGFGGTNYQIAAYLSALSLGMNLCYLFLGKKQFRYAWTQKIWYKIIQAIAIPIQVLGVLLTGGRGGALLVIVYIVATLYFVVLEKNKIRSVLYFTLFLISSLAFYAVYKLVLVKSLAFTRTFDRAFQYISASGINWEGTSGRDVIYEHAIKLIGERIGFGYSPFGYLSKLGIYPHNLFLDILLSGGIVFLILFLVLLIVCLRRLFALIKIDSSYYLLFFLAIYSVIDLSFSNSYLREPIFNFVIGFLLSTSLRKRNEN